MNELKYRCVLFCEDIRQETGGRVSLMGVLGSRLFVQEFPLKFPKFCLFVEWGEITGKFQISLKIKAPDGVNMGSLNPTAIIQGQPGLIARSMIVLNPFEFITAGNYVFEFWANDVCVGRESFLVEKFEPPPKVTN
ncbi:hypothetical protein AUK22_03415 [bacterium CG2_30_54_10]|nr:MAG: hypothetical protein AUK22_03415 [bacterium CG2_30_54_10]